jgi:hypothetical protein
MFSISPFIANLRRKSLRVGYSLSKYAMKNPLFSEIVGTKEKTVTSTDAKFIHKLKNINELVGKVQESN